MCDIRRSHQSCCRNGHCRCCPPCATPPWQLAARVHPTQSRVPEIEIQATLEAFTSSLITLITRMFLMPLPETQGLWKEIPALLPCPLLSPPRNPAVNLGLSLRQMEDKSSQPQMFVSQAPAFPQVSRVSPSAALQQKHLASGDFLHSAGCLTGTAAPRLGLTATRTRGFSTALLWLGICSSAL